MSDKHQHLQFIQDVITRMSNHSFVLKGWMVTIAAGLVALSITEEVPELAVVACGPTVFIWCLDSYFLMREKQFRVLHDAVRLKGEMDIDFDMNPDSVKEGVPRFREVMWTRTMWPFYAGTLVVSLSVFLIGECNG